VERRIDAISLCLADNVGDFSSNTAQTIHVNRSVVEFVRREVSNNQERFALRYDDNADTFFHIIDLLWSAARF
jgi:hypothetical protein